MNKLEKARKKINKTDKKMAKLFEKRMEAAAVIADYKRENGLPVLDRQRENEVVRRNAEGVNAKVRDFYIKFIKSVMEISREYQEKKIK